MLEACEIMPKSMHNSTLVNICVRCYYMHRQTIKIREIIFLMNGISIKFEDLTKFDQS